MTPASIVDTREEWDGLVAAAPGGHVLQSWAWGELKTRFGWRVQRVAAGPANAQVLYRPLPAGLGTIAYVPKGPQVDFDDPGAARALLAAVEPLAWAQRAICLKIEPHLPDDPALAARLGALGFRPGAAIQPPRTVLVDLTAEPEELLADMKQGTRYKIRKSGRRGVTVRPGGEADLPAFYALMEATSVRSEFGIHSRAYYRAVYDLFVPAGQGQLLLAEYEGQLLAALVVLAFGDTACYMYGASSDERRNLMATYLIQWEAMLWARAQGCRVYDLWGVPDQQEEVLEAQFTERGDGLWGVYRFKRNFFGRLARSAGAWDLVYAPLRYRLYGWALGLYRRLRAG
ncbi:MAG: peptidoglycan bridge formation glycyltransferase FemA/FemB family protein [Anaerolineae bacterium]|jgi:lipid II:glycine glycyltransferase (peptidoglycan interpeptide bridge formation enzyme)